MDVVPAAVWSKERWRPLSPMSLPASELWVHHGAIGNADLATLRSYDRFHVRNRGWAGLGYSYAIVGDGTVYEGRGTNVGAHTRGRNSRALGVCLVGDWSGRLTPPRLMVEALADLTRHLHDTGALARLHIDGGHGQAPGQSTTCPGRGGLEAVDQARLLLAQPTIEEFTVTPEDEKTIRRLIREEVGRSVAMYRLPANGTGDGLDGQTLQTAWRATFGDIRASQLRLRDVDRDFVTIREALRGLLKRAGETVKHDPPDVHGV